MLKGAERILIPLRIETTEGPNNLYEFSLGSITALAAAGSGWNTIQNSSNAYHLEPDSEDVLYQLFYGIYPSYVRVYRQFQSGVDRGALRGGVRNPGVDNIGWIDGQISPIKYPSPITELYTVKGVYPAFYAFHPYAEPSSITPRMTFYVFTYGVTPLSIKDEDKGDPDYISPERLAMVKTITMGGRTLMQAPGWLQGKS